MSWQAGKRDDEISRKEIAADDSGWMTWHEHSKTSRAKTSHDTD
jgi:hypothetical protein